MTRTNTIDVEAARTRCVKYRRRILDISQQVMALHIGSAYSCTEIVDCIYHGLMRRNDDGTSPDELLDAHGIGETKAERYGEGFLEVIAASDKPAQ